MKEKIKKTFKLIFLISIILTISMYWYDQFIFYFTNEYDYGYEESWCSEGTNIAVINIHGEIVTYFPDYYYEEESASISPDSVSSEEIVFYLDEIEKDEQIKAIILNIDSYGGYLVASEEIMNAIKKMTKPTVAVIRGGAVSGGYLIASGADRIYASEMSDLGGIGITMSYLDYSQQNKKEGVIYQQLSSGKFKDTGDPDKDLTIEEKELFMRDLKISHEIFVKRVAENRELDIEKVEKLADGFTMLGRAAKENGLIDEVGDIYSAKEWIRKELKIEPEICVYK